MKHAPHIYVDPKDCRRSARNKVRKSGIVTIYGLLIRDSGHVFYVGRTTGSLKKRLSDHYSNKGRHTVYSFLSTLNKPEVEIFPLEECLPHEKTTSEEFWVQQMNAWGFELLNIQLKKSSKWKHYHKKPLAPENVYTRYSEEEKELMKCLLWYGDHEAIGKIAGCTGQFIRMLARAETAPGWAKEAIFAYCRKKAARIVSAIEKYNNTVL